MITKLLFILALCCFSFISFTQTYTAIDSVSQKKIKGFKMIIAKEFTSSKGEIVEQTIDTLWDIKNKSAIEIKRKFKPSDDIIYFVVSHPDYRDKKIEMADIKNFAIPLVRNGITEEFCIKLFTVKDKLDEVKRKQLESNLSIKGINEIVRKDGRFAYTTPPMKNLYKSIDQLEMLKATKNPEIKDSYLLFTRTQTPVYFRIQFAVAHEWMVDEFRNPKYLLEKRYSLAQIQTEDNLHRVVSKMKYNDYADAVKAFSEKVRVRISNKKTVIIACTKVEGKERVITSMNL